MVKIMCGHLPLAVTVIADAVLFLRGRCYGTCARCRRFMEVTTLVDLDLRCIECACTPAPDPVGRCVVCARRGNRFNMSTWSVADPWATDGVCAWDMCVRCAFVLRGTEASTLTVTDLRRCRETVERHKARREFRFMTGHVHRR